MLAVSSGQGINQCAVAISTSRGLIGIRLFAVHERSHCNDYRT